MEDNEYTIAPEWFVFLYSAALSLVIFFLSWALLAYKLPVWEAAYIAMIIMLVVAAICFALAVRGAMWQRGWLHRAVEYIETNTPIDVPGMGVDKSQDNQPAADNGILWTSATHSIRFQRVTQEMVNDAVQLCLESGGKFTEAVLVGKGKAFPSNGRPWLEMKDRLEKEGLIIKKDTGAALPAYVLTRSRGVPAFAYHQQAPSPTTNNQYAPT